MKKKLARKMLVDQYDEYAGEKFDHYLMLDKADLAQRAVMWDRASTRHMVEHENAIMYILDECTTLSEVNDKVADMIANGVHVPADIVFHTCRHIDPNFAGKGMVYGNDSYYARLRSGANMDVTEIRAKYGHEAGTYVFP